MLTGAAQRSTEGQGAGLIETVRAVTATLALSAAKPIIDVRPIPAHTNERASSRGKRLMGFTTLIVESSSGKPPSRSTLRRIRAPYSSSNCTMTAEASDCFVFVNRSLGSAELLGG